VLHVAAVSYLPLDSLHADTSFSIEGEAQYSNASVRPTADLEMVTPGYFRTFGIRIVKGRSFTDADNESSLRVAMVNETFAQRFFNGVDPLRHRVVMQQVVPGPQNGPAVDWQIVGVFHTVKSRASREDNPEIETPFWQEAFPVSAIGVRTAQDPAAVIRTMAAAVNAVDPGAALYEPRTMDQVHDEVIGNDRFTAVVLASFAVVALLLSAVGVHGLAAFSVSQRSHEIAVRIALGATRNRILGLVMKEGLVLACCGLGLGLIGSYFVGRVAHSVFYGVGAIDFSTLAAVGSLLFLVAFIACYVPARRAMRVDPMMALRYE
jgi:putative ABC transport system permease protein